jgi:oligopeptide/dipeptide ABC transporter ATP-binding protein
MIRVRDLRVWYPLRKGLFREVLGATRQWARAVDGVSFDIRKGEVLCLVGESGCGKTSTGRAILKLTEATGGDVFLEVPDEEVQRFREASKRKRPDSAKIMDEVRRKYSITWKESIRWTGPEGLLLAAMVAFGILAAFLLPAAIMAFLTNPFTDSWKTIGFGAAVGVILGTVATWPPGRLWRRLPLLVALLSAVLVITAGLPTFFFAQFAGIGIEGSAISEPWNRDLFGMLLATSFAPMFASGTSALLLDWRTRTGGLSEFLQRFLRRVQLVSERASAALVDRRVRTVGRPAIMEGILYRLRGFSRAISTHLLEWRKEQAELGGIRMRALRRRLQLIFQDPYESLNPKQSVYEIVAEPLLVNRVTESPEETTSLVLSALRDAGLRPPEEFVFRFPHELSGGQRQRVSIAAALVLEPDFIVADEPVSMLDVSIRTGILQLMMDLRKSRGLTYLFITHDLGLAWIIADRIAVMYLGKIVEIGTAEQVIREPQHPYTQALISVVPSPDPRTKVDRVIVRGERPDAANIPGGCRFHPRCPKAFEACGWNAEEVAADLQILQATGRLVGIATISPVSQQKIAIAPVEGRSLSAIANGVQHVVAEERDRRLALKAIREVIVTGDQVTVRLHQGSMPKLTVLAPEHSVACHLITPPEKQSAGVTA